LFRRRRTSDNVPGQTALEASVVCALMLLFSPMSSKPHFATLLLPGFLVARSAAARRSVGLGACLAVAVAAGLLSDQDLWGGRLYRLFLWRGSATAAALALLAGCAALLWPRRGREEPAVRVLEGRAVWMEEEGVRPGVGAPQPAAPYCSTPLGGMFL